MDRLQQIGGGDIGHVERRVLTHQDHVDVRAQVQPDLVAEGHMVALDLSQRDRPGATEQSALLQRQGPEIIDPLAMAARSWAVIIISQVVSDSMSTASTGSIWMATLQHGVLALPLAPRALAAGARPRPTGFK